MDLKRAVKGVPGVEAIVRRLRGGSRQPPPFRSSGQYWEERYRQGGNSGAGSYDRLAEFKAEFLNDFVQTNGVTTVIEFGSGDGAQLERATYPAYIGVDVAPQAVELCRKKFRGQPAYRFIHTSEVDASVKAELSLSLDVIYHLVEDEVFDAYMRGLFDAGERFVIVYASNEDKAWTSPHVRHRRFTDWVEKIRPEASLIAHVPNRYPYDEENRDHTSFADFFVYEVKPG